MIAESEAHLLARCRSGEASAWDELFHRHYAPTRAFVQQLGFSFTLEDAEEISQEAFLSVVRNLASFRRNCEFRTWLFRIAINKAKDYRQRQRASKRGSGREPVSLESPDPATGLPLEIAGNLPGPDYELLHVENMLLLAKDLDRLDDSSRELVELRYFAELTYEEIGRVLELNAKTVGTRLTASLSKMKAHVDRSVHLLPPNSLQKRA